MTKLNFKGNDEFCSSPIADIEPVLLQNLVVLAMTEALKVAVLTPALGHCDHTQQQREARSGA